VLPVALGAPCGRMAEVDLATHILACSCLLIWFSFPAALLPVHHR
jgi:hypothetical protein